jgi:hypothetical protein
MRRHLFYLRYVLRHKWFVFWECLKLGVPLWIALVHDWDKFLPDEWFAYARTFYKSDGSKQYVESPEFADSWQRHQARNQHHWQWWLVISDVPLPLTRRYGMPILVWDRGNAQKILNGGDEIYVVDAPDEIIRATPMSDLARREMLADWRGAGLANGNPDTAAWYAKNCENMKLNEDTRLWVEAQLYKKKGERFYE